MTSTAGASLILILALKIFVVRIESARASELSIHNVLNTSDELLVVKRSMFSFEMQANNISSELCRSLSTCYRPGNGAPLTKTPGCSCHPFCFLFNDCCWDAPVNLERAMRESLPTEAFTCYSPKSKSLPDVHMITTCPEKYAFPSVAERCRWPLPSSNQEAVADLLSTPITDSRNFITYRNVFCAMCWGVPVEAVQPWQWSFHCGESYDDEDSLKKDSVNLLNVANKQPYNSSIAFLDYLRDNCSLRFIPSLDLATNIKTCLRNVRDDCPNTSYLDARLVALCQKGPTRRVYYKNNVFRNEFCAACNGHSDTWTCEGNAVGGQDEGPSAQFSVLVSPTTGDCQTILYKKSTVGSQCVTRLCQEAIGCFNSHEERVECKGFCPAGSAYQEGTCRLPETSATCDFVRVFNESLLAFGYWSSFVNDTLVVRTNETTALCFSCVITSFAEFNVSLEGSIAVALNGSRKSFRKGLFYLDKNNANVCAAAKHVAQQGEDIHLNERDCCSVPGAVFGVVLCVSYVCLVTFIVLFTIVMGKTRACTESCDIYLNSA